MSRHHHCLDRINPVLDEAIAKAIAKSHRGSIQVESELGKGSTFTVRLPLIQKMK